MAFDFDYYLIDEVMAVGDAQFRQKCQLMFREKLANSRLILVSHSMRDINEFCDVVVLVARGQVRIYEDVAEGIAAYQGDAESAALPNFPPHIRTRTAALRYLHQLEAQAAGIGDDEPAVQATSAPAATPPASADATAPIPTAASR